MIPLRVKLKGFLCYNDEQEVTFDGSTLWMLTGLNGSGKSAIFDGVTFALFGHHRGGSTGAAELINKNCEGFDVEFDFLQDAQAYRLHRTLKRRPRGGTHATQQIYRRTATNGTSEGHWEAVPDTTKKLDFDAWTRDNIGLSYETFTSSVLLLQGKAEKLLDSTAKGRFEVLAGIVDLARYRKLHEGAEELRRQHDAERKSLVHSLDTTPEITAAELVEAEAKVEAVEQSRCKAWHEVERLQALEFQAKQWLDLSERQRQLQERLRQMSALLREADDIERDDQRLKELQAVLPTVKNAMEQQRELEQAGRALIGLNENQTKIATDLAKQEEEIEQNSQKQIHLEAAFQKEESRLREIGKDIRALTGALEKLHQYERQEHDLQPLQEELKQLPCDPARDVNTARAECDRLTEVAQAVPLLARLLELQVELRQAIEQEKTAAAGKAKIENHGKQLKAKVEQLKTELAAATKTREQADNDATRARTLAEQAQEQLRELVLLRGAKVCRHCGQDLTPAHLEVERKRREREAADTEAKHQQAAKQLQNASAAEKKIRTEFEIAERQRGEAREEYRTQLHQVEQAAKDIERLKGDCNRIYHQLAEPFRQQIGESIPPDWLDIQFPNAKDVAALTQKASALPRAKRRLNEAEKIHNKWNQCKALETNLLQSLSRLQAELPADRDGLRRKHANLDAEEKSLQQSLEARRTTLDENQKSLDDMRRQREKIQQELAKYRAEIQTHTATQKHCTQTFDRAIKELPDDWKQKVRAAGLGDFNRWQSERDELVGKQTEQRARELVQARATEKNLNNESIQLTEKLKEFSEEAQQGPTEIAKRLSQARDQHKEADEVYNQTRQKHAWLQLQKQQREQMQKDLVAADGRLAHSKLLAELLGRERLQLHLVRQAERQVVDHANSVLDRLSGGELYLRLSGEAGGDGATAKALELEAHNRVTGEQPINVAFLSGSQKFRVAVSLALGIGQYASRQHRPIESVIIDEGFGCLDKNARQVMIQEMQNLRTQMRCILLVSHQEEFADAFSDGYHFELQDGSTVARRFQR